MKPQVIMDIECYRNYFLVQFLRVSDDKVLSYELTDGVLQPEAIGSIRAILANYELITFNGTHYDMPILAAALSGANNDELKRFNDDIIQNDVKHWQFYKKHMIPELRADHIDLIEVAPGTASLKLYGGRLHAPKLQDLPIEPSALIEPEQHELMRLYCLNDLQTTKLLLESLQAQVDLRRQMSDTYGLDVRSRSDAQIAEVVLTQEVGKRIGKKIKKSSTKYSSFTYVPPAFIRFDSPACNGALDVVLCNPFTVKSNGVVELPETIKKLKVCIGDSTYQMGMGGLHSTEESVSHYADEQNVLLDIDVASYYPSIILQCGLHPDSMGEVFSEVYKLIVDERLEAKRAGDKVKANSLKITINGSFGKLGSPYSTLYAPNLLIQVTLTGQLALLMLIEKLEGYGIPVVSGNTDGLVVKCPRGKVAALNLIIKWWEKQTGFEMEQTEYLSIHSRDVNNYLAIKPDGKIKTKGIFAPAGLQKNACNEICTDAVVKYLTENVTMEEVIRECDDIRKFVTIRTVKGGAVKGEMILGKVVRWYYAVGETGTINYRTNGNKVPRSDGAKPLMDLPDEFPADLDYEWYITEAKNLLKGVGL